MQPKLEWQKHKGGIWTVPKFPFFTLVIKQCWNYNEKFTYEYNGWPFSYSPSPLYNSLQEAQIACEQSMLKSVLNWEKENYNIFKYSLYAGNIGCGKYDPNDNKHHWITAGKNVVSKIYREQAIRFDISIPKEQIIKHALKIHKRHSLRFIRLMQS